MSNAYSEYQDSLTVENTESTQDSLTVENTESTQPALAELAETETEMEMEASSYDPFKVFNENGLVWLEKSHKEHGAVVRGVLGSLGRAYGPAVMDVVAFHKNMHTSLRGKARLGAFRAYGKAVAERGGVAANFKDAWYGGSKEEICRIVSDGFICRNDGIQGIQLSPIHYPFQSVMSTVEDEKGIRHILLCRVLLGNTKTVPSGTEQLQPCFEIGIDSIVEPGRYIIRSAHMNSFILPNIVVSFKLPGNLTMENFHQIPHMKIAALFNVLSNHLLPNQMAMVGKYHSDFLANKISREEFVKYTRAIAGDELLKEIIKSINSAASGNKKISGEPKANI